MNTMTDTEKLNRLKLLYKVFSSPTGGITLVDNNGSMIFYSSVETAHRAKFGY